MDVHVYMYGWMYGYLCRAHIIQDGIVMISKVCRKILVACQVCHHGSSDVPIGLYRAQVRRRNANQNHTQLNKRPRVQSHTHGQGQVYGVVGSAGWYREQNGLRTVLSVSVCRL